MQNSNTYHTKRSYGKSGGNSGVVRVTFVNHPELRLPNRADLLISRALELVRRGETLRSLANEQSVYKGLHACGFMISLHDDGRRARPYEARRRVIESYLVAQNLGLVYSINSNFRSTQVNDEDWFSDGHLILLRAIRRFNPWRGFRFSTYAYRSLRHGYTALVRKRKREFMLNRRLIARQESANEGAVSLVSSIREDELIENLKVLLMRRETLLTPFEREIVERRWMRPSDEKPATLRDLGDSLGLSKERVRQIQIQAMSKLREALETAGTPEPNSTAAQDSISRTSMAKRSKRAVA